MQPRMQPRTILELYEEAPIVTEVMKALIDKGLIITKTKVNNILDWEENKNHVRLDVQARIFDVHAALKGTSVEDNILNIIRFR